MSVQQDLFGKPAARMVCPEILGDQWISFGGGVQTVALMLINWKRMIMADTGTEWPETVQYLRDFVIPFCRDQGLRLEVCSGGNLMYHYLQKNWVPVRFPRQCTLDFKVRPMHKWLKINSPNPASRWLNQVGISTDEAHRMKNNPVEGYDNRWPLLELGISRKDCYKIIPELTEDLPNGPWPVPPKSGCFCCPFQKNSEFARLKLEHPELFERSVQMEESASKKYIGEGQEASMWLRGKPLRVLFPDKDPNQLTLGEWERDESAEECGGNCFL